MKILVSTFFREYAFHLRTASSSLLLKYINSVLILHLQLQQHKTSYKDILGHKRH